GGNAPFFVFKNVGDVLGSTGRAVTGSISYSVNGGASHSITNENSGTPAGSITANDLFFFGVSSTLTIGDVVTLTIGTVTTNTNVAAAPPAGGNFTTYITDSTGTQVSTNGVPVPEPGVLALLATAGATLAGLAIRRRSSVR
ncbi:MAG: PEP-CTERM sorting domain-containing protein, partial [Chthoniobacterales bacterium]